MALALLKSGRGRPRFSRAWIGVCFDRPHSPHSGSFWRQRLVGTGDFSAVRAVAIPAELSGPRAIIENVSIGRAAVHSCLFRAPTGPAVRIIFR